MEPQTQDTDKPQPTIEERIALLDQQPPEGETQPSEDARTETEDTTEVEETAAPESGEEPAAEPKEEGADAEDEDVVEIASFSDLIEHVGAEADDMYQLTLPVTINGKTENVPLGELKDAYHSSKEAQRYQQEAKAIREQAEAQTKELEQRYAQQLAQGQALVQALEKQALERFDGIDWNELRQSDPAEWSARRTEMESAKQHIEQTKQQVAQQLQSYQQQMKQQQDAAFQEHLQKEREALNKAWPEMADETKGKAERAALIDELKHRGFSDQEIGNAADHRILLLARDAMRYRQGAEKADAGKKKVVRIAKKVLKPGAKQDKTEQRSEQVRPLRQQLKKSGHVNDAARLLSALDKG